MTNNPSALKHLITEKVMIQLNVFHRCVSCVREFVL